MADYNDYSINQEDDTAPDAPATVAPVGIPQYSSGPLPAPVAPQPTQASSPEDIWKQAESVYRTGGMAGLGEYTNSHPDIKAMIEDPALRERALSNPNPKNESSHGLFANGMLRAFDLGDMVHRMGAGAAQAIQNAKYEPGSAEDLGNKAYFQTLTRGGGIGGAVEAYNNTYANAVKAQQEQQKLAATYATEMSKVSLQNMGRMANTQLQIDAKRADSVRTADRAVTSFIDAIAPNDKENIDSAQLKQYGDAIRDIALMDAKGGAAEGVGRQLMARAVQEGRSDTFINALSRSLNGAIPPADAAMQKTYADLRRFGVSDAAIARQRFGSPTEADSRKIALATKAAQAEALELKMAEERGKSEIATGAVAPREAAKLPFEEYRSALAAWEQRKASAEAVNGPGTFTEPAPQPPTATSAAPAAGAATATPQGVTINGVDRTGGSMSWRHNNPGNIKDSAWTQKQPGYVGSGQNATDGGKFAIFATEQAGENARRNLMFGTDSQYSKMSVDRAIRRYSGTDQDAYVKKVTGDLGISPDTPMSSLTADQQNRMMNSMKQMEGWKEGKVSRAGQPVAAAPTASQQPVSSAAPPDQTPSGIKPLQYMPPTKQGESNISSNVKQTEKIDEQVSAVAQQMPLIENLRVALDKNPEFWGAITNSSLWRTYADSKSDSKDREALDNMMRNMNVPQSKRAEFDAVMNAYRALQTNSVATSGLSASQTNSESEGKRVVASLGSPDDRPEAAKAQLIFTKAKLDYIQARSRAWSEAQQYGGRMTWGHFLSQFDGKGGEGERIFADAKKEMQAAVDPRKKSSAPAAAGPGPRPVVPAAPSGPSGTVVTGTIKPAFGESAAPSGGNRRGVWDPQQGKIVWQNQ